MVPHNLGALWWSAPTASPGQWQFHEDQHRGHQGCKTLAESGIAFRGLSELFRPGISGGFVCLFVPAPYMQTSTTDSSGYRISSFWRDCFLRVLGGHFSFPAPHLAEVPTTPGSIPEVSSLRFIAFVCCVVHDIPKTKSWASYIASTLSRSFQHPPKNNLTFLEI